MAQSTWIGSGNTSWSNTTNWSTGVVPNAVDTVVDLGPATTTGLSLSVGTSNFTIGSLSDNSTQNYSIIGQTSHGLVMQASSGNATIIMGNTGGLSMLTTIALILNSDLNVQTTAGSTGTLTKSGPNMLTANNHNIFYTGSGTGKFILSAAFTGTGGITQSSSGTLLLSGANTYSGGTILNSGILGIDGSTALGATASTLTINGGSIDNANGGVVTLANNNAQNWNSDFTFIGTKGLNLGTGAVTMNASRTVTISANFLTVSGAIDDGGNGYSLTKNGAGILVLSGVNTYTGGTILNAGTLQITIAAALGPTANTLTINGGAIDNTNSAAITIANNNAQNWNGDFTFVGTSNLNLGTGAVTMNASRTVTVFNNVLTVGGAIGDGGSGFGLTKTGTGTLTLTGANTYSGGTIVPTGALNINADTALGTAPGSPTAANVVLNGGTLQVAASLTLNANRGIALGDVTTTGSGTIDTQGFIVTYSGVLTDNGGQGGLNKAGTGTLILSGTNTYSGATILNAGTLEVDGSLAAGSAVSVNNGATLSGTGTVGGAVTTSTGGILNPGSSGTGTLSVASLIATGATTIKINLSNTDNTTLNALTVAGAMTNSSGSILFDFGGTGFFDGTNANIYTLLNFGSNSGFVKSDFSYINLGSAPYGLFRLGSTSLQFEVIPEPAIWTLAAGIAGLGLAIVRRKKHPRTV